jgi:hypothetical protein
MALNDNESAAAISMTINDKTTTTALQKQLL